MGFASCQYILFLKIASLCSLTLIIASPLTPLRPISSYHAHEKAALLQFKQSFLINCASSLSPNPYPKVNSWGGEANGDCCSWDGVECNEETGHVIGLDLSSSCLRGTFPSNSSIFSLSYLEMLNLADNGFNYSLIPSEVGQLSKLRILNLSSSVFSGQIPSEVSKLSQLKYLDLSFNGDGSTMEFSLKLGDLSLQRLVQNLTRLITLRLSTVDISSPVPITLTNITSLKHVSLEYCYLYGELPTRIFHLPRLEKLLLANNEDLEGSLPEFPHNSPLRFLDVSKTSLSGKIPPSIENLAYLEELLLHHCHFSGSIPTSLGNLTKLVMLKLSFNDLSGDIPPSLTNLTRLQELGLSNLNTRPEKLFSWLFKLNKLSFLGLASMNLVGEIPSVLANFTSLTYLDLWKNDLTGQIPMWLMNMTQLEYVDLSYNQLEGPIQGISKLANLQTLLLEYNNDLHGNLEAFLKMKYLQNLDMSGVSLTYPANKIVANESVAKLKYLTLSSSNLNQFPLFLQNQDKLEALVLAGNSICGLIPQWLVNVTRDSLYLLNLGANLITGFEQHTNVLPWNRIKVLVLKENKIQGLLPIPPNFIAVYHVSQNMFYGGIPQQICNIPSLNFLDISFNNLSGQIPDCIGEHGYLSVLNMQGNNFHGTIPRGYPKACRLKMINLSQNQLVGDMPRSLVNCTMLQVLDISNNHVKDTFPSWLGSLRRLQILVLGHNNFHGKIKKLKGDVGLNSLHILDLSHNFHTGDLPSDYFQECSAMRLVQEDQSTTYSTRYIYFLHSVLYYFVDYNYSISITVKGNVMLYPKILTAFRVVDFSSNNFTGKIPSSIGELRGLQALNLSNNNLDGNIPSSLTNLIDLESFDLSSNLLVGDIPQGFEQLTSLEVFNVSYNHLVGRIPQGRQFNTFDYSSFKGNLALCGSPLPNKCSVANEPPQPPSDGTNNDEEEDYNMIDWIIRSLGCVGGFVVGYAIGKYITDRNHEWFVEIFGSQRRRRRPQTRKRTAPNRRS